MDKNMTIEDIRGFSNSNQRKQDDDFFKCLGKHEEMRKWQADNNINSWAFRQALIYTFQLDSLLAQQSGKSKRELDLFDFNATKDSVESIKKQMKNNIPLYGSKLDEIR